MEKEEDLDQQIHLMKIAKAVMEEKVAFWKDKALSKEEEPRSR